MNEATIKTFLNSLYEALSIVEQIKLDFEEFYEDSKDVITEDDYLDTTDDLDRWYDDILDLTSDIESKFDLI